jgi:hypothetical protein
MGTLVMSRRKVQPAMVAAVRAAALFRPELHLLTAKNPKTS